MLMRNEKKRYQFPPVLRLSACALLTGMQLRRRLLRKDTVGNHVVVQFIDVTGQIVDLGQHREEIVNAGFDAEVVEKIHQMLMRNEKKRYQFPPVWRPPPRRAAGCRCPSDRDAAPTTAPS